MMPAGGSGLGIFFAARYGTAFAWICIDCRNLVDQRRAARQCNEQIQQTKGGSVEYTRRRAHRFGQSFVALACPRPLDEHNCGDQQIPLTP